MTSPHRVNMARSDFSRQEPGGVPPHAPAHGGAAFEIVLTPLSPLPHPEPGDIRIGSDLFAVGRGEPPFASMPSEAVADLSRRHAKIFAEHGAAYVADLGSKNGTTVNGVDVRQKTSRLQQGDELCFGRLCYRVQIHQRAGAPPRARRLLSMTLAPTQPDLALHPIVVTRFPFLVSKTDAVFAQYKESSPQQVNYLSRRHAHLFVKDGLPHVEDLGSTNGTFVNGERLAEHAVPLHDGDVLAFGGHHFVYKIGIETEDPERDATVTQFVPPAREPVLAEAAEAAPLAAAPGAADPPPQAQAAERDKTTFVAAADSFLDIFCIDPAAQQDDEVNAEAPPPEPAAGGKPAPRWRKWQLWSGAAAASAALAGLAFYVAGAPERNLKTMMAQGEFAQAARTTNAGLGRTPDDVALKAANTDAALKAYVPAWMHALDTHDFGAANNALAAMTQAGSHNPDIRLAARELGLLGRIQAFVLGRGGPDAPLRLYRDEDSVDALVKAWSADEQAHQQAAAIVTASVPAFSDANAGILSHLRKLQGDDAVYVPAMARLKDAIADGLNQGRLDTVETALNEAVAKYPRIAVDAVRHDLQQYAALDRAASSGALGTIVTLMESARFATPPFRTQFTRLVAAGRLPPADVVRQYDSVASAWNAGNADQAITRLEAMRSGPWAGAADTELARKKQIAAQFRALQIGQAPHADANYYARLLAFHGALDPAQDRYFLQAAASALAPYKDTALKQAQETSSRAQAAWARYRANGGIDGRQRLESAVSNQFRTQAGLLASGQRDAQTCLRIYTQLKLAYPLQWKKTQQDIDAETEAQRKALLDLRNVLEPGLLKAKLALIGGDSDENR